MLRVPHSRSTILSTGSDLTRECWPLRSAELDAFVFTAGIGEHSIRIRARIAEKLGWLGIDFDPAANAMGKLLISPPQSDVRLYVVPTDEELMIARHTLSFLAA